MLASLAASTALTFALSVPSCPAAPQAPRTQTPERASSLLGGQRQTEQVSGGDRRQELAGAAPSQHTT